MKALSLFISIIFYALAGHAQYGMILVKVPAVNPSHQTRVTLIVNGLPLTSFSHSQSTTGWVPLRANHLSISQDQTPVTAQYNLQQGCNFNFEIYFSMDGKTSFFLGSFHAPNQAVSTSIPLTRKCEFGMPLCSHNSTLQQPLIRAVNRARIAKFNEENREYNRRLRERYNKSIEQASVLENEFKAMPLPDFDQGQKVLEAKIQEWQSEFDKIKAQATQDEANGKNTKTETSENLAEQAQAAVQNQNQAIDPMQSGNIFQGIRTTWVRLDDLAKNKEIEERQLNQDLENSGQLTSVDKRTLELVEQNTNFIRRDFLRGKALKEVAQQMAEAGVTITGGLIEEAILSCELVTGQRLCFGEKLSNEEVAQKACELIVGKIYPAETVKEHFMGHGSSLTSGAYNIAETAAKSGVCSILK